jgi:hypothetical protein
MNNRNITNAEVSCLASLTSLDLIANNLITWDGVSSLSNLMEVSICNTSVIDIDSIPIHVTVISQQGFILRT